MKLAVFSVGRERADASSPLTADYLSRIAKFLPIEDVILKQDRNDKIASRIFERTDRNGLLVALDETGKMFTSIEFAKLMTGWMNTGIAKVTFVIGGADGLPEEIKKKANLLLSLSPMTFPHRLARLFLAEQIYRGLCIVRGVPYQK